MIEHEYNSHEDELAEFFVKLDKFLSNSEAVKFFVGRPLHGKSEATPLGQKLHEEIGDLANEWHKKIRPLVLPETLADC